MFRLLGPVRLELGARDVDLGPVKQRGLLASLLLSPGQPVPTTILIDRLWGDDPPLRARNVLATYVTRLRRIVEAADDGGGPSARFRHAQGGYQVDCDPQLVDLLRARRLVREAHAARDAGEPERERDLLDAALAGWQPNALAGIPGDWAERVRDGLHAERLAVLAEHAGAALQLGRHGEVIEQLRPVVTENPTAEALVALLLTGLAGTGQPAEAMQWFARTRRAVAEALGCELSTQLQDLHLRILRGDPELLHPPAARSAARPGAQSGKHPGAQPGAVQSGAQPVQPVPRQLPADVAGFTARGAEIAALDGMLDDDAPRVRVVAVSGTAGVGKTALAVRWAHRAAVRFPDGQLYVNLRGFDPGGQVLPPAEALGAFLGALGVARERIPADPQARAALYRSLLSDRRMLVVLDNARDADQVRPLIPGTPGTRVLVTSRNRLTPLAATDGARLLPLDLLTAEEARGLLVRRVGADRVAAEPAAVTRIIAACARLPLALAVAAALAQESGFTLSALAAGLARTGERLAALDAGDAATDVRAVLSWSYDTLDPPAARLFRLLGLHSGPDISAAAAASLAGITPAEARRLLSALTRANLLAESAPGRYTCHDLLRDYAADLTGDVDPSDERRAAVARLLDHFAHTAYAADRLLQPHRNATPLPPAAPAPGCHPEQPRNHARAMSWLATECPVLLATIRRHANTGQDATGPEGIGPEGIGPEGSTGDGDGHRRQLWLLIWSLDTFLERQGLWNELWDVWRAGIAVARDLDVLVQAESQRLFAWAATLLERYPEAHHHYACALRLHQCARDPIGEARTHFAAGFVSLRQDQPAEALDHSRTALRLYETAGHQRGRAHALSNVGWCRALLGDHRRALADCEQALSLHLAVGDHPGAATTWDSLGYLHHQLRHRAESTTCYEQAVACYRRLGNRYGEATTLANLAEAHHTFGAPAAARTAWTRALDILTDLDHPDADVLRARLGRLETEPCVPTPRGS